MDKTVPKEKLIELWSSRKKKAIEIIKNDGKWPNKVEPVVDKQKTEEYYDIKSRGGGAIPIDWDTGCAIF